MAKNGKKAGRAPTGEKPKACYVLSLSVENVRCFGPKQTLDLSDGHGRPAQWTIILGENGTGKTTLLQLLVSHEATFYNSDDGQPTGDIFPRSLHLVVPSSRSRVYATPYGTFWGKRDRAVQQTELTWLTANGLGQWGVLNPETTGWRILPQKMSLDEIAPTSLVFHSYGASRRPSSAELRGSVYDHANTLFTSDGVLRSAEEWLLRLDYSTSKQDQNRAPQTERLQHITSLLTSGLLPGVDDLRFQSSLGPNPTPWVEFHTPYGWVPLRQLGYGYQTVIAWMLDFVSRMVERYPDSPDPLKEPAICVVDEIDLHLHPAWQRKLIGFLSERFPNTQFIATAHSPLVVQAAENANIAVLKREGDHVVIHNDVDDIRNWRVDQILTSDLFGLESARSPRVERILKRQEQLAGKARLTLAEKKELKELQDQIDHLPVGRSAAENEELAAIRQALDALRATSPK